jgi:hypothetical protein
MQFSTLSDFDKFNYNSLMGSIIKDEKALMKKVSLFNKKKKKKK